MMEGLEKRAQYHLGAQAGTRTCESCGHETARGIPFRGSRFAEIAKHGVEPGVGLCKLCWLDRTHGDIGDPQAPGREQL